MVAAALGLLLVGGTALADPPAPFAFGDFTWMNGTSRQKDFPLVLNRYLAPHVYVDAYYAFSLNRPYDDTLTGASTLSRHNELQIILASIGASRWPATTAGAPSLTAATTSPCRCNSPMISRIADS